jgi:hypothetical protein
MLNITTFRLLEMPVIMAAGLPAGKECRRDSRRKNVQQSHSPRRAAVDPKRLYYREGHIRTVP